MVRLEDYDGPLKKTVGRQSQIRGPCSILAIVSTTFCVKAPPIVLTPMIVVGLMLSMAATKVA